MLAVTNWENGTSWHREVISTTFTTHKLKQDKHRSHCCQDRMAWEGGGQVGNGMMLKKKNIAAPTTGYLGTWSSTQGIKIKAVWESQTVRDGGKGRNPGVGVCLATTGRDLPLLGILMPFCLNLERAACNLEAMRAARCSRHGPEGSQRANLQGDNSTATSLPGAAVLDFLVAVCLQFMLDPVSFFLMASLELWHRSFCS